MVGEDTDTAGNRLALLNAFYRQHPVTGPTERSAPTATAKAPLNLAMVDHIDRSLREVVDHTRAANPEAGPLPDHLSGVYKWMRDSTENADETVAQRTAVLEYRHRLEHAVRAGDAKVIRPHRCLECGTVGLFWQAASWRAVCVNRHCAADNGGVSRSWTLSQLAHEHVVSKESLNECAT